MKQREPTPIGRKTDKASANDRSLDSIIAADKAAALKLAPVSHETEARLDRYIALLREWMGLPPLSEAEMPKPGRGGPPPAGGQQ